MRVRLLGGFRVQVGARVIEEGDWRLRKAASLVKMLALSRDHWLHRDRALDLLWPDLSPAAAANNLHRTLFVARQTLEPGSSGGARSIRLGEEKLALYPESPLRVDIEAFEEASAVARGGGEPAAYRAAIELYAGDLLPDDLYEPWAEDRRTHLRKVYLAVARRARPASTKKGKSSHWPSRRSSGRWTRNLPWEEAHVGLMRLRARSGQPGEARRQYERLARSLDRAAGVEPSPATRRLLEEIEAEGPAPDEPARRDDTSREVLPSGTLNGSEARGNFVGRRQELVEIKRALSTTALLTLTGTGGTGKTRLAQETVRDLTGVYPDGAWLVELAPLSEAALVPRAVAEKVGVREEPGRPLEAAISEVLRDRQALLVLDNCEHLVRAAARLADSLLGTCPSLRILATSRQALGVTGETVWRVPPLSLPERAPAVGELEASEAARLFADRAASRASGFALTPENAGAVADVCRKLDGIPLAIELAAARIEVLSVGQISAKLGDSLGLLTTGDREAPSRQKTLRGALDWSHELLPEDERALFGWLSVFAGGFTLGAAEEVCSEGAVGRGEVLDLLSRLVEKSLVAVEERDVEETRYGMLETVRQYALEKLTASGQEGAARDRHAEFFLDVTEEAEPGLAGGQQGAWLARLDADSGNLRAALGHHLATGPPAEGALRMAGALRWFWFLRGRYGEGRGWLEEALARGDDAPPLVRAKTLTAAGDLAFLQSEYDRARELLGESLTLYRSLDDRRGVAEAVQLLGSMEREQGRYVQAEAFHEEALALWRELGDEWGVAQSLNYLGFAAWLRGNHERAVELCGRALGMFRASGDGEGIAWSLMNLGAAALYEGERARAEALLGESLALSREGGYQESVAWSLDKLGVLALRGDLPEKAESLLRESLTVHHELGDRWRTASVLEALAWAAGSLGRSERAGRLFGAAEALREDIGDPVPACERDDHERAVAAVRARMGEEPFAVAWTLGRTMHVERAAAYALSVEPAPPAASRQEAEPGAPAPKLTRREGEIADLVAEGLTNSSIADELVISRRTVDTHVHRILRKLGLNSREQLSDRPREGRPGQKEAG